jgi:aspartyl-tRNA(Asn)/glutamyl-tRNA(Gln) amidotransferase subunit C
MDADDVRKLALLARLRLSDAEVTQFGPQIGQILEFVHQLSELDTTGVEPMTTALDVVNRWQEDRVLPGLAVEQALSNAPQEDGSCFLVPPVIGPTS